MLSKSQASSGIHHKILARLWTPFRQEFPLTRHGVPDITPLARVLGEVTDGDAFTCLWNEAGGDQQTVLNYFGKLLTGFDIVSAELYPQHDKPAAIGQFHLMHTRPLLAEWEPTGQHMTCNFRISIEPQGELINHLCFKCKIGETLVAYGCPEEVAQEMASHVVKPSYFMYMRPMLESGEAANLVHLTNQQPRHAGFAMLPGV